jgi:hypothetical protein
MGVVKISSCVRLPPCELMGRCKAKPVEGEDKTGANIRVHIIEASLVTVQDIAWHRIVCLPAGASLHFTFDLFKDAYRSQGFRPHRAPDDGIIGE